MGRIYDLHKRLVAYGDLGVSANDRQNQQRELAYLTRKASRFDLTLIPMAMTTDT